MSTGSLTTHSALNYREETGERREETGEREEEPGSFPPSVTFRLMRPGRDALMF